MKHENLMETLEEIGLDRKDLRVIRNQNRNKTATVQLREKKTELIEIRKRVRQGCNLSPDLITH